MIIGGKKYETYIDEIPIENLEPDFDQPRRYELQRELESRGLDPKIAKTAKGIEMTRRFEELVNSIVENEGISMPLVVEKTNEHYKVLEGDRRLGATRFILANKKILSEHPILKERLAKLPCLVVKGPLQKEDRLRLLAHIHIHLAQWRPVAKQKVIMDLRELIGEDRRVAATMGVTPSAISKTVAVEEMAKKFSFKGPSAISYARNLLSLRKSLLDEEVIEATVKKVKDGKITSPIQIRELRRILPDPEARKVYLKPSSTIEDAENVLRAKEFKKTLEGPPVIDFSELLNRLVLSLKNVKFEDLVKYKGKKEIKEIIDNAIALLQTFKSYV
jgi:hypothetical protein